METREMKLSFLVRVVTFYLTMQYVAVETTTNTSIDLDTVPTITDTVLDTVPTITDTTTDLDTVPTITDTSTDLDTIPTITDTSTDLDTVPTLTDTTTDLDTVPTITDTSTDLDTVPTITDATTDLDTVPTITDTSIDLDTVPTITNTTTDLDTVPTITDTTTDLDTVPTITDTDLDTVPTITNTTTDLDTVPTITDTDLDTVPTITDTTTDLDTVLTITDTSTDLDTVPTITDTDLDTVPTITNTTTDLDTVPTITDTSTDLDTVPTITDTTTDLDTVPTITDTSTDLDTVPTITDTTTDLNTVLATDHTNQHGDIDGTTFTTAHVDDNLNKIEAEAIQIDQILDLLIYLHIQNCSSTRLCFSNSKTEDDAMNLFMELCCHPCSCDATCYKTRTCCLSFYKHVNTIKSEKGPRTNATDSKNVIDNDFFLKMEDVDYNATGNNVDVYEDIRLRNVCVQQQVAKAFHTRFDGRAYLMVDSCSTNGIKLQRDAARRCKTNLILPVTSLKTNMTYVNIYCLYCNEGDVINASYLAWTPELICQMSATREIPAIRTSSDLYSYVNTNKDGNCNMLFFPPSEIMPSLTECVYCDVTSCNVTGAWTVYNRSIEAACLLPEFSPGREGVLVFVRWLGTVRSYKNIACYLCNFDDSTRPAPMCFPRRHYENYTYASMELQGAMTSPDTIPGYKRLHILLEKEMKVEGTCAEDYFFDIHTRKCRQLYCPKDYLKVQITCVPALGILKGANVAMTLRVQFTKEIRLSQIGGSHRKIGIISKLFTGNHFIVCHFTALAKLDSRHIVQYLYFETIFNVHTANTSFHEVLKRVDYMLQDGKALGPIFDNNKRRLNYKVTLSDRVTVAINKEGLVSYSDIEDGSKLHQFWFSRSSTSDYRKCGTVLNIGTTSYCASVQLLPSEFSVKNRTLRINVNNEYVYGTEFDLTGAGRAFVCVNMYNKKAKNDENDNKVTSSIVVMAEASKVGDANERFIIVCVAIMGAIVGLFIVVRIYQTFCRKLRH